MPDGFQQNQDPTTRKVRIPVIPAPLPEYAEMRVKRPPFASIFDALADNCNGLMGYRFLRSMPIVVAPWSWQYSDGHRSGAELVNDLEHSRFVCFKTSPLAQVLLVAVGYSAVRTAEIAGARRIVSSVTVNARKAPNGTVPASGQLIDPGFRWRGVAGSIPSPIVRGGYAFGGLMWLCPSWADPSAVAEADPVSDFPRLLVVPANSVVEVGITWEYISVNALFVAEAYRPEA